MEAVNVDDNTREGESEKREQRQGWMGKEERKTVTTSGQIV